ncbi:MAG: N-acetyl-gamma-glutamyl-phosphate reductase [Endomicrobium sp.]|jgi:N-acetyl-gamma-glutamyl-phosphate reductase|nr:N-acetyl-gamma-glutamyl-phosphate reductase [Endomicrobium sp.]
MIRVGIIGITGYTGEELLRILSKHTNVKITGLYARKSFIGQDIKKLYPCCNNLNLTIESLNLDQVSAKSDVVFLALPHAVALNIVPTLFNRRVKIIDLSADFRLHNQYIYEQWYKVTHTATQYLEKAVYGLSELYYDQIKQATLIANPGCYPTSIILGCAPVIKNNLIDLDEIIIDAKSGISGAGRKNAQTYLKTESQNFKSYNIAGQHRHIPEIEQELSMLAKGRNITINFTPHIIPIERGMLSTIYMNLKNNVKKYMILEKYQEFYSKSSFIKINDTSLPETKDVLNTNFCKIGFKIDYRTKKLIIISVIDNLMKGASGQAVQNMNIMFGLKETTGLL